MCVIKFLILCNIDFCSGARTHAQTSGTVLVTDKKGNENH